jgi:hypothetical protein
VTAVTLPVSLAAAAVTLRKEHPYEGPWGEHWCEGCEPSHAVADLIDGMLAAYKDADERLEECAARGIPASAYDHLYHRLGVFDGLVLPALVPLVRAFLPDWNPDTEETP